MDQEEGKLEAQADPEPTGEEAPQEAVPEEAKEGQEEAPIEESKVEAPAEQIPETEEPAKTEEQKEPPVEAPVETPAEAPAEEKKQAEPQKEVRAPVPPPAEAEKAKEEEDQSQRIPKDYFYPENYQERKLPDSSLSSRYSKFHWCSGFDALKRHNVHFLSNSEIIYGIGTTYHIFNLDTQEKRIFFGKDGKGIGAITVDPSRQFFAIGEKGEYPNVYIYEYPSMKLYRILRRGTERAFSAMAWSSSGSMLATVGSFPDYMLTVWDWLQEKIILKSKAFGQEIYTVQFSPKYEEELITSGTAHIRFWKMAKTFTGLKLQGEIGKFGQVELSDVNGFVELPDGKVLSGTEYGNLLLWEGNLIKALFMLPDGSPCHEGAIDTLMIIEDEVLSAGVDGQIKWWDLQTLMMADPEEGFEFQVECKHSVLIGEKVEIVDLIKGEGLWLVVDRKGKLWKFSEDFVHQDAVLDFHSGKITDVAISPIGDAAVTVGEDCTTRLWDYVGKNEMYSKKWIGQGTCIDWAPPNDKNQGKVIAVGFDNGIMRLMCLTSGTFELLGAWKAHDAAIIKIKFSPNGKYLATAAADATVFFFEITDQGEPKPVCITPIGNAINNLCWHESSDRLLLALQNGTVSEINRPDKVTLDTTHSYEVIVPQKIWRMRMMDFQKAKEEDDDDFLLIGNRRPEKKKEEEWPPAPIHAAYYHPSAPDRFLISVEGPYIGYFYECDFNMDRPIKAIPTSDSIASEFTFSKDFWISAHQDGSYQLRSITHPKRYMEITSHDVSSQLSKVILNSDQTLAVSIASDSTVFFNQLYPDCISEAVLTKKNPAVPETELVSEGIEGLNLGKRPDSVQLLLDDILDPSTYSLQMDKLKTDEDKKRSLAEMKKQRKRQEIMALRNEFQELLRENENMEPKFRLNEEELNVDPEFTEMLIDRNKNLQIEVHKETAWKAEYFRLCVEKYKKYFMDSVAMERFQVHSLQSDEYVTSFRVNKPSDFFLENLRHIQQLLEEEGNQGANFTEPESFVSPGKFSQMTMEQSEHPEETKTEFRGAAPAGKQDAKKKTKAQEDRELRTKLREERKRQIELKKRQEPSSEAIDPVDKKNIEVALATMGDFKLKTSPDYVVPKSLCINASQKRRQMFLLIESAHTLKMELNNGLLALRDSKKKLLEWIEEQNVRISEINKELSIDEPLFIRKFHKEEWPEDYYAISDADLSAFNDRKLLFAPQKETNEKQETKPRTEQRRTRMITEAEKAFNSHRELKLMNEKKLIEGEISKRVEHFDAALSAQKEQKLLLEADLKQIEMKLITYYQELNLLDDLEPDDQRLSAAIESLNEEKLKLLSDINDINKQYEIHQKEQEQITKRNDEIQASFNEMVEGSPFAAELEKIFKRNVKRKKKKKKDSDEEAEENEEEEDEEEESDLSSDESDEDQNLDLCPPDCDMNLFEDVVNLRESRLDVVDDSTLKKQIIADLKKKQEEVERNERRISHKIQETEQEIQTFQREKMKKLNLLNVSLTLMQDQIQVVDDNNSLPPDLSGSVLFTNNELQKLRNRIVELKEETAEEVTNKEELQKDMKKLERSCKMKEKMKEEARQKFEAIQALRFGHAIKLENLKYAEPSVQLAKLKNDHLKAEKEAVKRYEQANETLMNKRDSLRIVMKRNTDLLEQRARLFEKIMKVNKQLDLGNREIFKEEDDNKQDDIQQEQLRLQEIIDLQRRKISELKTEINLFRRKGGHIYTKITANRKANIG